MRGLLLFGNNKLKTGHKYFVRPLRFPIALFGLSSGQDQSR
jgi:hypothetical protein